VTSNLPNLVARRDLLRELTTSEFRSAANETTLGWLWWLIDPLFTMLIYWVVVEVLFERGAQYHPYPVFILCAILPFKHFSASTNAACKLLRSRESLIKSVPFPTMVLPLSLVFSNFGYFLFGLVVLLTAAAAWGRPLGTPLIQLPALMSLQLLLVSGVALAIAAFGALIRDLSGFMTHLLRIFFYACPTLYGVDMVKERFHVDRFGDSLAAWIPTIYMLNPLAILFTGYRDAIFYGRFLEPRHWTVLSFEAVLLFVVGYRVFQHFDRRVIKFL
jgi:ABC-type polysaccharide/polyol phosphate export permease